MTLTEEELTPRPSMELLTEKLLASIRCEELKKEIERDLQKVREKRKELQMLIQKYQKP